MLRVLHAGSECLKMVTKASIWLCVFSVGAFENVILGQKDLLIGTWRINYEILMHIDPKVLGLSNVHKKMSLALDCHRFL